MTIADLGRFLGSLSELLGAHQGKKVAEDFAALCKGLEPFAEFPVPRFSEFLRAAAEEYKRSGSVAVDTLKPAKRPTAKKTAAAKKSGKDDVEAIGQAVAGLNDLYNRVIDPAVTYPMVDDRMKELDAKFDTNGLKAVAVGFGVTSGLTSKKAALDKMAKKIKDRKAAHLSSQAILQPLQ